VVVKGVAAVRGVVVRGVVVVESARKIIIARAVSEAVYA